MSLSLLLGTAQRPPFVSLYLSLIANHPRNMWAAPQCTMQPLILSVSLFMTRFDTFLSLCGVRMTCGLPSQQFLTLIGRIKLAHLQSHAM
jgi:hypothetical protein